MNPHGNCSTCAWSSVGTRKDQDGDTYTIWQCWIRAGEPCTRLATATDKIPPACDEHLKA